MLSPLFVSILMFQEEGINPWTLPIRNPEVVTVSKGLTDMKSLKPATAEDVAASLDGQPYVIFGEQHDSTNHKRFVAELMQALVRRGRNVSLGMEMFTRPNQKNLAPWSMGYWTEEQFIEKANWKTEWGFDFSIYRPVLEVAKEHKLPLVALNVPRPWVRAVGRGGPNALPEEAKSQVPPLDLTNAEHRRYFEAMIGGHPTTSDQANNMYSGQVLWDTGMADTAIKYVESQPASPNRIMVILAGSGHAAYDLGINLRIRMRTGQYVPSVIGFVGGPQKVSRGIGDWVLVLDKG